MSWWGKVAGGAFGFMLGGPLGALLGTVFGHQFDKGLRKNQAADADLTERTQLAFFTATFAVMGYVAKADGRVSEAEIGQARRIMAQMKLDEAQRQAAIQLFNAGKARDFDIATTLEQLEQTKNVFKTMRMIGETAEERRLAARLYAASIAAAIVHHDARISRQSDQALHRALSRLAGDVGCPDPLRPLIRRALRTLKPAPPTTPSPPDLV